MKINIGTVAETKKIMDKQGIRANKSLGQNFLVAPEIIEKICSAAQLENDDNVLEVGSGLGALSEALVQKTASLCLLELDGRLCTWLNQCFFEYDNVEIINGDALSFNYIAYAKSKGWGTYKLLANMPYYITTPLLKRFLLHGGPWQSLTLMMQKEVADKILAGPKQGGALSLLVDYFADTHIAMTVSSDSFYPQPEVNSAVIHFTRLHKPPVDINDINDFSLMLNYAFGQRRKTLVNSLARSACHSDRDLWLQVIRECNINKNVRAEELNLVEFAHVYRKFLEISGQQKFVGI